MPFYPNIPSCVLNCKGIAEQETTAAEGCWHELLLCTVKCLTWWSVSNGEVGPPGNKECLCTCWMLTNECKVDDCPCVFELFSFFIFAKMCSKFALKIISEPEPLITCKLKSSCVFLPNFQHVVRHGKFNINPLTTPETESSDSFLRGKTFPAAHFPHTLVKGNVICHCTEQNWIAKR